MRPPTPIEWLKFTGDNVAEVAEFLGGPNRVAILDDLSREVWGLDEDVILAVGDGVNPVLPYNVRVGDIITRTTPSPRHGQSVRVYPIEHFNRNFEAMS